MSRPMSLKDRAVLILKGMCMGFADVVPGVSGGTMALVLGIYTQLINAIKAVDLRFVRPLWKAVKGFFRAEARADLMREVRRAHLPWLLTLAVGIGTALVIGSRTIPTLMERYPAVMFAFFFGLVLASVSAPLRILGRVEAKHVALIVVFGLGAFLGVGESVTPPSDYRTVTVTGGEDGDGQTLTGIAQAGPSALPPEGIYWDPRNEALRSAAALDVDARGLDPKAEENPYNELVVPEGTEVHVPAPAYWFIFIAGFFAICAMVLPGISGSFILLIFGSYYFVLNALKGFLGTAAQLEFPASQAGYVVLFAVGALAGLIIMTRVLSWLLETAPGGTMASLIGLMLGSLRAIWPFKMRTGASHRLDNVWPAFEHFGNTIYFAGAAFVLGMAIVFGLTWVAGLRATTEGAEPGFEDDDEGLDG